MTNIAELANNMVKPGEFTELQAVKAMEAARAGMLAKHPSLGFLTFKLNWIPDPTCRTAWTDGVTVGFNPGFVMSLNKAKRQFLCAHEVGHPMLGHHLRRGNRDKKKWNKACDHVVNLILVNQGFRLPEKALLDYQFKGMAVEEVYKVLFEDAQENQDGNQDSTESGQNADPSPSDDEEASKEPKGQEDSSDEKGEGSDEESGEEEGGGQAPESNGDDEGDSVKPEDSGSDGQGRNNDSGEPATEGTDQAGAVETGDLGDPGDVRDFPGKSEEDQDKEEQKWDIAVQQAAQIARKLQGEVPGFIETILTDIANPKLPWEEILSRWLSSKAKNDYSFSTPNPRYAMTGFFLPSLESQELGKVSLFWDTSCSVTDEEVGHIAGESFGILRQFPGVEVDLYHIDTKVQYIEKLDEWTDWDNISARGRGGTDFKPGFQAIEESPEEQPVGVVYMTDGECSSFPETPPSYPVLWIIVGMPHHIRFDPPFGEVAYYEDF